MFRTIFLSDTHLGNPDSQPFRLLKFVQEAGYEKIIRVGDIFDFWLLGPTFCWGETETNISGFLLLDREAVVGNHDEELKYFGSKTSMYYETKKGKIYRIEHGHAYDPIMRYGRTVIRALSLLLGVFRDIEKKLTGKWSISDKLASIDDMHQQEQFLAEYRDHLTRDLNVDGVICGHVHYPEDKIVNGKHYLNCGDWMNHCSFVAEDENGKLGAYIYEDNGNWRLASDTSETKV